MNLLHPSHVKVCHLDSTEIVYATYHVDVGETPFFIGVDFDKARIVISIRGTLSMQVEFIKGTVNGNPSDPLYL